MIVWVALGLLLVPWVSPVAAASATPSGAPVSYGHVVATGVLGVPYAQTTGPSFPDSYPPVGSSPLGEGAFIYDTSVSVEIVNTNTYAVTIPVYTETWTPGTETVTENVTLPNGTIVHEPETVPARLDPIWNNGTVSAAAGLSGTLSLSLPADSAQAPLQVTVGSASWTFTYLTPATSAVSGILTTGGVWAFAGLMALVTFTSVLAGLVAAGRLARSIGRSPRVPVVWPLLWVTVPVLWFGLGYVSFNQTLGAGSPLLLPAPLVVAAFPYLPRIFSRGWDMVEVEGITPLSLEQATNPKVVLPIVTTKEGLRCAPETWREAFLSHFVGLPEVRGYEVKLPGGAKARVQPRLIPVSNPLTVYYRAEETASCWYDARRGIKRPRHGVSWWVERTDTRTPETPGGPPRSRVKRRLSPHIVPGFLEATFPPKKPVALVLADVHSAEVSAHDAEAAGLENAELRGQAQHLAIEYGRRAVTRHERGLQGEAEPRSADELERQVQRADPRSRRRDNGGDEPPAAVRG